MITVVEFRAKQATWIDRFSFEKNKFESTFNKLWVWVFFNFISSWVIVWQIATSVRPVILTHFFFSVYKGLLVCLFISTQWGQKLYDVAFNTWFTLPNFCFVTSVSDQKSNNQYPPHLQDSIQKTLKRHRKDINCD